MPRLSLAKLVAQYEAEPLFSSDGNSKFHYVIEIYQRGNVFYPKVRRNDHFTIKPDAIDEACSEELLVVDIGESWEEMTSDSAEGALEKVVKKIENLFKI